MQREGVQVGGRRREQGGRRWGDQTSVGGSGCHPLSLHHPALRLPSSCTPAPHLSCLPLSLAFLSILPLSLSLSLSLPHSFWSAACWARPTPPPCYQKSWTLCPLASGAPPSGPQGRHQHPWRRRGRMRGAKGEKRGRRMLSPSSRGQQRQRHHPWRLVWRPRRGRRRETRRRRRGLKKLATAGRISRDQELPRSRRKSAW
jgi:hypothetical protein